MRKFSKERNFPGFGFLIFVVSFFECNLLMYVCIHVCGEIVTNHLTRERWEHGMASFGNGPYNGGGDFGTRDRTKCL
ncbi:hypothetical protein NC653_040618 [Populus alba x Populus x berolinensis]|uniref:Uncharacterized protein n=1 Tax=Populus alba x Populus x berolinensis TaxID=444605 RepID=A0AAD6L6X8_9ROSI|nr:hypothetical protein NC653_040618 [Populus alba x Populus x berolinensis]